MKALYTSAKRFLIILVMTAVAVPVLRAGSSTILPVQIAGKQKMQLVAEFVEARSIRNGCNG